MITKLNANERGTTDIGWLKSNHSFSFGHFYDVNKMGYASLRVINDDIVAPAKGFGTHPHDNMEIITYVLDGQLAHKDSMGNIKTLSPGEVQVMSAGTGLTHSEYNNSKTNPAHFLQVWIEPNIQNAPPQYDQKLFTQKNTLQLIASEDARQGSLPIKQNASIYIADLDQNQKIEYKTTPNKKYYIHIATGSVTLNNQTATAGDAFTLEEQQQINITATTNTKFLLFELE